MISVRTDKYSKGRLVAAGLTYVLALCLSSCNQDTTVVTDEFEIPSLTIARADTGLVMALSGEMYYGDTLFSGYLVEWFDNGSISRKQGYLNGKAQGNFEGYYPDGQPMFLRPYHHGEKHGEHLGYYSNGQLKFRYFFEHGMSTGNHLQWYEDGSKHSSQNYEAGREKGLQQVWRPDGKLRSNYVVRENGRKYGLVGLKRCTKLDGKEQEVDPYKGSKQ